MSDTRDLVLTRLIDAPREKVYRAWTDAELLKKWFAPAPLTTPNAELDVRPGGANRITMRLPDGTEMPNAGVYLEVAESLTGAFKPPPDYHESHTRFLDALDRGDGDGACEIVNDYLERHDRNLVSALEVFV